MKSIESELINIVKGTIKRDQGTQPYDTTATVTRVENGTAWVHIDGGVSETPVRLTVDAHEGDTVQLRVSGGSAWIVGNETAPPTDDSTANYAVNIANDVRKNIVEVENFVVQEFEAEKAVIGELEADNATIKGNLTAATARIGDLEADTAKIHDLTADQLTATVGYIDDLTSNHVTAQDITADHATVGSLDSNYAHITNGVIDNAKIGYADVNDLNANYASINLANVNNAWIENGVIKDAAISDAQIIGVSANKLTAGTIDASKIDVTNLNADNLTVGTINGQRIGNASIDLSKLAEEVPTKEYLDNVQANLQGQIDGQIETWTGTVVPTLNNSPASSWTTAKDKKTHVGDIYYVVNAGNSADGYTYRFTENTNGTYSWTLIKDNQITKALQDIINIQGDVSGIKDFDTQISSWKTDTDDELSSIKSRTSTLETDMGKKVNSTTFNELKQTVDENSATITSLSDEVDKKADGSTVTTLSNTVNTVKQTADTNKSNITTLTKTVSDNETDIEKKYSDLTQDVNTFKTTVGKTYQTKDDMKNYSTTTQMNSAIEQKAGEISLSVAKEEIGKIEVGGTNLCTGSSDEWYSIDITDGQNKTINLFGYPANGSVHGWLDIPNISDIKVGDEIHVSFDVKFSSNWKATGTGTKNGCVQGTCNGTSGTWTSLGYSVYGGDAKNELEIIMASSSKEGHIHTWFNVTSAMLNGTYTGITMSNIGFDYYSGTVSVKRVMVEKCTTPSTWSPAPEDLEQYADNAVTAFSSKFSVTPEKISSEVTAMQDGKEISTRINQTANDVKIKASKVEIDGTAVFNSIKSSVESTANAAVSNLEIGGRNLLLYSDVAKSWTITLNTSNYQTTDCYRIVHPLSTLFKEGDLVTVSFDWSTTATGGNFHLEAGIVTPYVWGTVVSATGTRSVTSNYVDLSSTNKSGHCEITFKITASVAAASTSLQYFRIRVDGADANGKTFTITNAKAERGSKATDWTPAPEQLAKPNLTPFFSFTPYNTTANQGGTYWYTAATQVSILGDGWAKVVHNNSGTATQYIQHRPKTLSNISPNTVYTLMIEIRNASGTGALRCPDGGQAGANAGIKYLNGVPHNLMDLPIANGTFYKVFTTNPTTAANYDLFFGCCTPVLAGNSISYELRLSLYEGEYYGPYSPFASTIIDGANILTGTVTANQLNGTSINASKMLTVGALTEDTQSALTGSGFTILWDKNYGTDVAGGEAVICLRNPQTGTVSPTSNGWVMFNGVKRTIPLTEFNPNSALPYNIPIYLVLRLSSATATTGTLYAVFYQSGWKNASAFSSPSTTYSTWTWNDATDIILGKCVEPGSEAVFTECETYDPPWTSKAVSNATTIAGGRITTNSITANHLTSNSVTADKIASNSITIGKLASSARASVENRVAMVGQSSNTDASVNTNNWYKFASVTATLSNGDYLATFNVRRAMSNGYNGTLEVRIRTDSNKKVTASSTSMVWSDVSNAMAGIATTNFCIAYKADTADSTVELWCKIPWAWESFNFQLISESSRTVPNTNLWTLYTTITDGSASAPTSGYTLSYATIALAYLTHIDNNGIKIHPQSNENNYALINANGMTVYQNSTDIATFGATARIGQASKQRVQTTNTDIEMYDAGNNKRIAINSSIGVTVGRSDKGHTILNDAGLNVYTDASTNVAFFGSTARIGTASGARAVTTSTGLDIYNSSNQKKASYGSTQYIYGGNGTYPLVSVDGTNARLMQSANNYANVNSSGLQIYQSGSNVAEFGASARVGIQAAGKYNTLTDANGIHLRQNTTVLSEFTANGASLGKNSAETTVALNNEFGKIVGKINSNTSLGYGKQYLLTVQGKPSTDYPHATLDLSSINGTRKASITLDSIVSTDYNGSSINMEATKLYYSGGVGGNIKYYANGYSNDEAQIHVEDITDSSRSIFFGIGSGGVNKGIYYTNKYWIICDYGSDQVGIPQAYAKTSTSAANMVVGTSGKGLLYRHTTSSRRYKHAIEDISEYDLNPENLYNARIRQFEYDDDYLDISDQRYGKKIPGFIVEELEEVYPIAVDYNEDELPEDWNVRYLVPAMLKLIQDQHKEIEKLKELIA